MGGSICLFCLLVKPCSCPSGQPWRAEAAADELPEMTSALVFQLFRRVLEQTMGPDAVVALYAAVSADTPGLRSIDGAMLADRSFAPQVQGIIRQTLTDNKGGEMTRMVGHVLEAYTQALCTAVQIARTSSS
mmetsp:Transcript_5417/g.13119  ORF Transcript_5417/g.13119 Transcript_5417/m.13119 type:complete len:132 (+) Transcript_5417:149-544(+)